MIEGRELKEHNPITTLDGLRLRAGEDAALVIDNHLEADGRDALSI
jgi:hypothetical protein